MNSFFLFLLFIDNISVYCTIYYNIVLYYYAIYYIILITIYSDLNLYTVYTFMFPTNQFRFYPALAVA